MHVVRPGNERGLMNTLFILTAFLTVYFLLENHFNGDLLNNQITTLSTDKRVKLRDLCSEKLQR